MVHAHIRYSDKPFMGSVTHPLRALDTIEMAKIVFGADFVDRNTVATSLINANSPMVWASTMLAALQNYARANQATIITPFLLAGALSPRTAPGARAQTPADAMRRPTLAPLRRPGPGPEERT